MVIITKRKLIEFYSVEPKAKEAILKWYYEATLSSWQKFSDVKHTFNSVDNVGNDRFVFNVGGNKYRIVTMIHFTTRTIYIRFVGTHKQYNTVNCKTI